MKKLSFLFLLLISNIALISAQDLYERKVFVSQNGDSLNYRLLTPENQIKGKKYPLVLFLHGAGERGSDNQKQLTHGGQMFLNPVNREKYPAFVLRDFNGGAVSKYAAMQAVLDFRADG